MDAAGSPAPAASSPALLEPPPLRPSDSQGFRRLADVCLRGCSSPGEAASLEELFRRAGAAAELERARRAAGALERFRRRRQHKRALRQRLSEAGAEGLSSELLCPITMARPREPVLLSDGHVYERGAIEAWLTRNRSSPLTRESLQEKPYISWRTVELAQARLCPRAAGRPS